MNRGWDQSEVDPAFEEHPKSKETRVKLTEILKKKPYVYAEQNGSFHDSWYTYHFSDTPYEGTVKVGGIHGMEDLVKRVHKEQEEQWKLAYEDLYGEGG